MRSSTYCSGVFCSIALVKKEMRMTEATFKKLYQEYQESGLSVRDFCSNQDISPATFYRWKKILEQSQPPTEFVPLVFGTRQLDNNKYQNQMPAICEDSVDNATSLEFVFPNGTKLQLKGNLDIALLKTIIRLY